MLTNSFSAEFGRAGGAVVLVQTKSGTNTFHGDLYDFIQNDVFNANDYFANRSGAARPPVRRNLSGGTVGGPVWRDHLFFFGSGERLSNVGKGSISRFIWLPTDQTGKTLPRACDPGEKAQPGNSTNPLGIYCVDPTTHPNLQRDLAQIKSFMNLWNTPELQGKTPNDPLACSAVIASGRANRCVLVTGGGFDFPDSDYSGKMDWLTRKDTTVVTRYQYSRQIRNSPRIILGDNFGTINGRQYNVGFTVTHVFNARQTGEFRYGFGNRATLQDVTDGDTIPIIRFSNTLVNPGLSSDTLPFGPLQLRLQGGLRQHRAAYRLCLEPRCEGILARPADRRAGQFGGPRRLWHFSRPHLPVYLLPKRLKFPFPATQRLLLRFQPRQLPHEHQQCQ